MTMMTTPARQRGIVAVRADAGTVELRTVLDNLQRDWKAFKDEHAKGTEDVVAREKVDRIQASVLDLQAAVDQANAQLAAAQLGAPVAAGRPYDPDYSSAFLAHFRRGDVQANLNKGTASEGGYLAPVEWDRTITDKLVQVSPMRQIASIQAISIAGFTKLFNLRGTSSGWVGETTSRTETSTPSFGQLTYTPGELYAKPAATQQMLDDAAVNLEMWIAGEVETEFSYQEGLAFVSGNGANKPNGFLTYVTGAANAATHPFGAIQTGVAAASATAFTTDELLAMVYSLPSEFTANARWVMNRNSIGKAMMLSDTAGWKLWQPSLSAGQPALLSGYPVTEMAAMPNVATGAFPIAFGDFKRAYLIVDRTGIRVTRDPFTNKPFVEFYTTKRVGGGLLNPEPLRVMKMA